MNKKIVLSLAASILLATSVFASSQCGDISKGNKGKSANCKMMKKQSSFKKHSGIAHMAMKLDLSDEQRKQIRDIIRSSRKNAPKISEAFSDSSFDKQKFIDISKEKREFRLKNKAETIAKVYAILDDSQKKDLKTMIDMRDIVKHNKKNKMMKKGNCNDKNCNGRG